MVVGKLIIIPALGHQNKGKSSFTGSGLFVLMSRCRNNNQLAHHHVPCDRLLQKAYCSWKLERLSNECWITNTKVISSTNQNKSKQRNSEFLPTTCNLLKGREKLRAQDAIGFGFATHWFKSWRQIFKPITKRFNRNSVITFDGHLKTSLVYEAKINMKFERFLFSGPWAFSAGNSDIASSQTHRWQCGGCCK